MILTQQSVEQMEAEINEAIAASPDVLGGINSDDLVRNKDLIIGFLGTLTGLIPGLAGKVAGQLIIIAAKSWFANKEAN